MADSMAYQSVPPPSGASEPNAAFADALKRAKEIAARMGTGPTSDAVSNLPYQELDTSRKRPHSEEDEPINKKLMAEAGGMPGMPGQDGPKDPKSIALQVAASIAQRAGLGSMTTEEFKIPNKFVGLVIGRGGEQINKLQSETGAKIQVAPDPPIGVMPPPDRTVTINGSVQAVEKAKQLLQKICEEGKIPDTLMSLPVVAPGETMCEMMIPASKVGLIIGKGGETIKSLQERAQCRMVMIQDGPYQNAPEKPLRIMGDPTRCQRGKDLVTDLLTEKELESRQRGGPPPKGPPPNMPGVKTIEAPVPGNKCGLIIGKGGETIRQIINQTGAHVELNRNIPESSQTNLEEEEEEDVEVETSTQSGTRTNKTQTGTTNNNRTNSNSKTTAASPMDNNSSNNNLVNRISTNNSMDNSSMASKASRLSKASKQRVLKITLLRGQHTINSITNSKLLQLPPQEDSQLKLVANQTTLKPGISTLNNNRTSNSTTNNLDNNLDNNNRTNKARITNNQHHSDIEPSKVDIVLY